MKKMRIKKNNGHYSTYTFHYRFDGGAYYLQDESYGATDFVAVMDDGKLFFLFDGIHHPYEADYELYEE